LSEDGYFARSLHPVDTHLAVQYVTGRTSGGYLPGGRAFAACAIIRRDLHQQPHDYEPQLP
jgi:hypothetical protein